MKGKEKKGKIQKTSLENTSKWFTNVAKSFGFVTKDIIQEMIPSIYEFAEDNVSAYRDVISGIRDNSMSERMIDRTMDQTSPMIKLVNKGINNVLEDIKTGNFYNQQRDDELTAYYDKKADAEMFGGGGDDSFGFDDEDFGFGDDFNEDDMFVDEDDSKNDAKPAVQPVAVVNQMNQTPNMMPVAKAIANSNMAASTATIQMVQGFADQEKTFEIQRLLRTSEFNSNLFGTMGAINENLTQLVNFQSESQSKLVIGAISFFGDQLDISKQILEKFKGDEETPEQKRDNERAKNTKTKEDIFLSEGGLDFEAYFKNIKQNVMELEEFSDIFDMAGMVFDSDEEDMMRMVTQPLKFIPQNIIKSIIPAVTQDSVKMVDEMFSSFTSALMSKLNAWGEDEDDDSPLGYVKNFMGRVLGYKQENNKTKANLGKYEKGPVPFDGVTRRTITDVIPTYLRRIESAITGTNERVYDYDKGTFTDLQDMIKSYEKQAARMEMSGQSEINTYFDRALSKIKLEPTQEESFREDLKEYFKAMNDGQKMINPFAYTRRDMEGGVEEIDELDDNGLFIDDDNRQLFRKLLEGLDKRQIMDMVGKNVFKTVKNRNRFYEEIEADNTKHGYRYANDNGFVASDYETDPISGKMKRKTSPFEKLDKYGKGVIDYVRDLRSILLHGINVYIAGGSTKSSKSPNDERDKFYGDMKTEIGKEDRRKREKDRAKEQREERVLRDKRDIDDVINMPNNELQKIIDYQNSDNEERKQHFMDSLDLPTGFFGGIRGKIADKVIELTDKPTKAINDFLYKLIFGSEEEGEDFDSYLDLTRAKLSAFHTWAINNVYNPVKDSLIGPEGLVTKLKDSKFVKAITDKKNKIIDKLLGEKDLEGNRTGGWLSTFRNSSVDFFKSVKHYFTGEAYKTSDGGKVAEDKDAIFKRVKRGFETGMKDLRNKIFGNERTGDKGIVATVGGTLIDGINAFRRSMFGEASMEGWEDKTRKQTMDEFAENIAKRAPKALGRGLLLGVGNNILFSQAGMLGSIFLPGGPIGGMIVGTGLSILLESDRFKDWLFGKKDPNDLDRRLGGVIPEKLQDFYHDNKKTINIGGLVGAGFGLLPSFFLPGGPLTGAILGIGVGLATKSDRFQRFLYGDDFDKGDKKLKNGAIGKAFAKAKKWFNDEFHVDVKQAAFLSSLGAAAGGLGVLPSFFLPGGPIGGAILGVGAGIIASSNKFQTWLFGEEEFDGKRSGGLIDKFKSWFDIEIFDSLKITLKTWGLRISDFFQENIAEPFLSALDPMINIVTDTVDGVKSLIKAGWDKINDTIIGTFKENVIKPFGESLTKYVVDPLKKLLNTSFSILGKIAGTIIAAPFKLLGLLGGRVDRKVKKGKASDKEKEQREKYHDAKDERQRKREERRQKVEEDIAAMKEKQTNDREFFKRDGRFRNQDAKDKYEKMQQDKQLWYQQHIAESGAETADRLENIDKAIQDMQIRIDANPKAFETHEVKLFNQLQKLHQKLSEQLQYWKDRGYVDTSYLKVDKKETFEKPQDPFFIFNNTEKEKTTSDKFIDATSSRVKATNPEAKVDTQNVNIFTNISKEAKKYQDPRITQVTELLRRKGQSHDEGLENVPYDGYIAELHEGEQIVPANKRNQEDKESSKIAKEKHSWLKDIRKNTKIIADEVKDQLYGVGSNLHSIRKILQHNFGMKDEEVENLQDKNVPDYGFFGKLFRKVKNNISSPIEWIKDKITSPIDWAKGKVGAIVDGIQNGIDKLKKGVGRIANSLLKAVDKLAELPAKIIDTTLDLASFVVKNGGKVLFKGLELGLKATETVVSDLYKGTRFLVTSIAKSFVPALVGAGKFVGKVFQGLGTAGKFAIETVIGLGKGMYTVTKDILGFGYNLTKDAVKGVAHVGKTLFKGGLNLVKGALTGIKNVVKGGFGLVGGALGLIKSKVTGKKDGVQQVQVIGGNLDTVNYVGGVNDVFQVSFVDRVIGVHKVDSLTKVDKDVNVRIRTKEEQRNIRMQRVRDLISGKRLNMDESEDSILRRFRLGDIHDDDNSSDDVSIGHKNKNDATNDIQNGELNPQQPKEKSNTEKGREKQSYENQIKEQTEQTKKEKKQEEKEAEAKKDKEHVSRLTSDYVQEQKKKKKEEKLDQQYKVETMKDIDSSEKIASKQYKFWQNLLGKNGIVHTKLSSIWAWLLKAAPIALAWLKGTRLSMMLGTLFGGTGFVGALKGVLMALAPAFVALFIDNLDKWKRDERADKYNLSDDDAYLGVGDEKRYDSETGEYILNQDRKEARNKVLKNAARDVGKNGKVQKLASATRNVGRNARPFVSRVGSKIGGAASRAKGTFGRFVSKMGSKFSRKGSNIVRNGMSSTLNSGTIEILDEAGETIFKGSKYSITDVKGLGKVTYVVEKFIKLLRKAVTSVISFVGNKLGNSKLAKSAGKIMQPLLSKFSGSMMGKITSKFGGKISAFIAKKGAGAATFFILDGAFALWDLGTGQTKSETANLFAVNQDEVNGTMRTISAALKAITNFSIIGVINLANEISSELLGFNFLRSLACTIYKHVAGSEKNAELEKNQKALEAELQQYNQEHGTKLSKEAYLDKKNPSVYSKIMNNSWVKNFKSAFDKGDAANALGKNKDDVSLWDRVKFFGGHTANSFLNIFRSKENKRTDSEFMIGKTLVRGENGLPVLDENGNPMYEEDIKAGKVTSDGKVQKEGADTKTQKSTTTSTDNTAELKKKYGENAGMGDGPAAETDYQDITANFDNKATDANTWLESRSQDQNVLMRTIGSGFDTIKRVFFRWYSGDSKDTDRLVNKADDKLNLHDNRIWRNFGAFNWLTNLFQKDADKLTENSELDTISTFFDNTSQSIGAWILNKMNDAKSLLARIQAGFNSLTGSTLNIFGSDIKIDSNTNSNNSNTKLNFGDIVKRGIKNGINTMISANPVVGAFKAIGSGIGKLFGYAQGTPWVPDTQLALIHQGEMIVPAEHNPLNPKNKEKFDEFKYDVDKDTDNILNSSLPVIQNDVDNKIVRDEKVTVGDEDSSKTKKNGSFALDLLKAYRRITVDNLKITSTKTMDVNLNEGATLNINGIESISDEIIDAIKSKIDDKFKDGKYIKYVDSDDEEYEEPDTEDKTSDEDDDSGKSYKDSSYYDRHKDDKDYSMSDDSSSSSSDSGSSSSGGSSYSGDDTSSSSSSSDSGSSSSGGSSYSGDDTSSSSSGGSGESNKEKEKKEKEKKEKEDNKNKPKTLFQAIKGMDTGFNDFMKSLDKAADGNTLNTVDRNGGLKNGSTFDWFKKNVFTPISNFNNSMSRAADGNTLNTADTNKKPKNGETAKWFNKNIISPLANFGKTMDRAADGNTLNTADTREKPKNGETAKWFGGLVDTVKQAGINVAGGFKDWHQTESKKTSESANYLKDEAVKTGKSIMNFGGTILNNLKTGFTQWHNDENKKNKENLKIIKDESQRLYTQDDDKAKKYADAVRGDKKGKANLFSRIGYQLTKPITNMYDFFMPEDEKLKSGNPDGLTYEGGAIAQGNLLNLEFVKPVKTGIQALKNVKSGFQDWHNTESKKNKENIKVIQEEATKAKNSAGKWINGNILTPIRNVAGGFRDWHNTESKKNKENIKVIQEEATKAKNSAGKWINGNILTPIRNVAGGFQDWHNTESKKNKENLETIKTEAIGVKNKAGDWINKNIFNRISNFDKKANETIDQAKKDAKREKNDIGKWINNTFFKPIQNFDKKGNEAIDQVKKDAKREKNDIGSWINNTFFKPIQNFDKKGNEKIDQVKSDAKREKNDIGKWINNTFFKPIQNFDKKGNEKIDQVKSDAKREQKDMGNWFNKMQDSAGRWVNKAKTSLLSSISDNLLDSETATDKQTQRDKKAKEASNKRSKEAKDLHKKLTEGYENLKESAGNWADETKNYIIDQYNKNISLPLSKSSKQLQKQFAQLNKSTGGWMESAKEAVMSTINKTSVGRAAGSIIKGAKSLINNNNNKSNNKNNNNNKSNNKNNKNNNNNKNKSLIDKAKDAAGKAGDWLKEKGKQAKDAAGKAGDWLKEKGKQAKDAAGRVIGGIQQGASDFYHWLRGKGGSDTIPLKSQIKPKNYVFKNDDYKYTGSDKGKKDGGLRDKGNTHNFPFYSQLDKRWGADKLIGGDSIGRAGCGPTAAAMVLTHLTGERITPDTMAKVGADNLPGYANYKYFPEIASKFKLNYSEIDNTDVGALKSTLRSGKPVILSGFDFNNSNSSPFTDEGHIVVATGTKSNEIEINDPRGPAYSGSYNASDVLKGMKHAIVLEATKATKEVAIPSIEHLENVYYDQDYIMSEDLPDIEPGSEEDIILGGAGKIKLWQKVLGYARAFKNKLKYSYGSNAIENDGMSTDCSAFTGHVFKRAAGITLPRKSTLQGNVGSRVSSPLPADLVVWDGHVGIVADTNGNMIDAGGKGGAPVSKERSYTNKYWRARQHKVFARVLKNRDEMVDPTIKNYHKKIGFSGVVDPNANLGVEGAGGSSSGSSAPVTLDKYLFVGDSMLGNLKSSLESDSSSVQVRFKGGKTAQYWLDNFGQMPDKSKVDNVVSWIGVNGILNTNNYAITEELMNKLANKYGKAVHPMAVFPVGAKYKYKTDNASNMNPAIKEFNSKLQSYASSKGSTYIDATSGFVDDQGYLKGSQDNLHIYGKSNNDKIVQNIKTALGLGSSGSADGSSTGEGENSIPELGVFDQLSNAMSNVIASMYNGEQVDLFNGSGSSSGGDSSTSVTGTGDFPKYQLSDAQIKGIANIIDHEQPGVEGKYAEASIMANLTDINGDAKATTSNLIHTAKTWFAYGDTRFSNPGSPTSTAINAVKDVIIGGKRTLPRYVNEHDCFSDITSVSNNGKAVTNKKDRGQYKQHVTKIKNKYGAIGTFWGFPNSQSDPFYYTSADKRSKWGENCYSATGSSSSTTDESAGNGDLDALTFDVSNYDQFDFGESAGFGLDRPAKYHDNVDFLPTDRAMTESELIDKFGESAGSEGESGTSPGGIPYTKNNYAYLNQYDKTWERNIGGLTFSTRGCGPTTLAIIATQLTGKLFNPSDIAKAAYPTHWKANGAQWSLFPWFGNKFGMKWNIVPCNDLNKAKSELKAGHPIAVSGKTVKKGKHTPYTGGHIVPFVGLDSNNKIIVNDPQATSKAIAYEDSGLANGNVNILRQGWAFIPPAKLPSDLKPIGDYNGSTGAVTNMTSSSGDTSTDGTSSGDSSTPEIPELGIFDKLSNGMSNIIASMYNGQQVDLFSSSGSTDTSSTSDSSSSGGTTDVQGSDVAEQIYNYSKGRGASNACAAGVVGNAERESGLDPKTVAKDGSLGLFQWLMSEDQKALKALASKEGKEWSDVGVQMKYLWDDLENPNDYNSGRFDKRCGDGTKGSGVKAWKKFTSPEKAASMFERCYEISAETTKKREQFARKWYDKFNGAGAGYGDPFALYYDNAGYGPGDDDFMTDNAKHYAELTKEYGESAGEGLLEDDFQYNYDLYDQLTDEYGADAGSGPSNSLCDNIPATVNNYAYYCQRDSKWNKNAIGGHWVADSGCGPSSVAILATQLTGKTITPYAIAKAAYPKHWGACAQWSLFDWFANKFGLSTKVIGANDLSTIKSELNAGHPVIASTKFYRDPQFKTEKEQRKVTPYTPSGHIIPFVGVESSTNRLIVNDPQTYSFAHAYEDKWLSGKYYNMRQAWAYSGSAKVPSGIEVGGNYTGSSGPTTNVVNNTGAPAADGSTSTDGTTSGDSSASDIPELGIFDKLSNGMSNVIASMYNGQQVDLFASSGSTDTTSTDTSSNPDVSNMSDNRKAVWAFFTGKGYSKEATAGIMGNMHTESGGTYDPSIIQGNGKGPAAGICQWENYNTKSARWKDLSDYAQSKGKEWNDLQSQLEFIDKELAGNCNDKTTNAILKKKYGGYEGYKKMNSVDEAVVAFETAFERAGVKAYDKRKKYGKENYDMFANAGSGPAQIVPYSQAFNIGSDSVYYDQTDPQWNIASYGGNTLSESGCGPTSLAMIGSELTGEEITPDIVAKAAYMDGVWSDSASWNLFPWFARQLGLEYSIAEENDLNTVNNMLGMGEKVVASGILQGDTETRSPFTTYGHIVPFVKKTNAGYLINDPRGRKYVGVYKPNEVVNQNSIMRKAWGYKANPEILKYLKDSNLNPDLYKDKKEIENADFDLGPGSKQYNASELYENAGLGSKKKSLGTVINYGINKLKEQLEANKDIDVNEKLSSGVSAIEYGIDKLKENKLFNRGTNAKVIDKLGKMTSKYKNVIHTYRPDKEKTTENKKSSKSTLETFLERLNKLTNLTSSITDKMYYEKNTNDMSVEPEEEPTYSTTRKNKLIAGTPAPGSTKSETRKNKLIAGTPAPGSTKSETRKNKLIAGTPAPGLDIKDVQEKVTKPIKGIQLDALEKLKRIANKISENTSKINNTTDMTYVKECVEQLTAAVKELESINTNTKATADNVSKIQVYSENYPVSQIKEETINDKVSKLRQSKPTRQSNRIDNANSDEYKIARMIASFDK